MRLLELQMPTGQTRLCAIAAEYRVNNIGYVAVAMLNDDRTPDGTDLLFYRTGEEGNGELYEIESKEELRIAMRGFVKILRNERTKKE